MSADKWSEPRRRSSCSCCSIFVISCCLVVVAGAAFLTLVVSWYPKEGDRPSEEVGHRKKRLPGAVIIGVKKGGTRALLEYLRLHPSVKAPGPEVHFFDKHYNYGLDWYREQMVPTTSDQVTIEKTPSYFVTKEAPERLYAMNPYTKIIVVVRDPVTRALSDYTQNVSKRPNMSSFEEMAFANCSNGTSVVNASWGAIKIGLYHKHVRRWLAYFPRERMHFVDGQRLITRPADETNLVEEFLNLTQFANRQHFYVNSTKKFPCIIRPNDSARTPRCLGKTKGRRHPDVSDAHLAQLRTFFKSHNEQFFALVGRRFDW